MFKILKTFISKKDDKVTEAHITLLELSSKNSVKPLLQLDLSGDNLKMADERKSGVHKFLTKKYIHAD